jgi:transmembrane regulatory protein ToxS
MNKKIAPIALLISLIISGWLYWGSDFKLKQELTSREWQSKMITLLQHDEALSGLGPLRKVEVASSVKYLPNETYIRVSNVKLYGSEKEPDSTINISETGKWALSENYLLLSPTEFKDVSAKQSLDFSAEQLDLAKQFFKMDARQSRRVDIVNGYTLLLTSLSQGSTMLYAN